MQQRSESKQIKCPITSSHISLGWMNANSRKKNSKNRQRQKTENNVKKCIILVEERNLCDNNHHNTLNQIMSFTKSFVIII